MMRNLITLVAVCAATTVHQLAVAQPDSPPRGADIGIQWRRLRIQQHWHRHPGGLIRRHHLRDPFVQGRLYRQDRQESHLFAIRGCRARIQWL